jgi:hypothetical protein
MVFSQLYGLVFVDVGKVDFERGVGVFLKASLGLPDSFPHTVALALLHVKHAAVFHLEQILKLLVKWESRVDAPAFDALVIDRTVLFPAKVGLNAILGVSLSRVGISPTIDYRTHYQSIHRIQEEKVTQECREKLLSTEGRAFWTVIGLRGHLEAGLVQAMSELSHEAARIVILLFGDMLCWTSLKSPTRKCPFCKAKFTTAHFFSCSRFFVQEEGWQILVRLCGAESWEDVLDYVFHTLTKWVTCTTLCRADFRLAILSYSNICSDPYRAAFRWNT